MTLRIEAPMLAGTYDEAKQTHFPYLASAKLDGIRAMVMDGQLFSRNFKPIPNRHLYRHLSHSGLNGLDGELICGSPSAADCYRKTMSAVMSEEGELDVHFYVFDDFTADGGFQERYSKLKDRLHKLRFHHLGTGIVVVPHVLLATPEALATYEEECLAKGYEGVMLRTPQGPYKQGRSTTREGWLLKLKRFEHGEAVVLAMQPLEENHNAAALDELGRTKRSSHKAGKVAVQKLGALRVRDVKTGAEFNIGTGFTDEQRLAYWDQPLLTKIVRYKFFPSGNKTAPRFPVFDGWRSKLDL